MSTAAKQDSTNIDLVRDEALEKNLKESRESLFKTSISIQAQQILDNRKSDLETKTLLETIKRKHEEEKRKKKSAEFSKTRYNVRTPQAITQLLDLQANKETSPLEILKKIALTFSEIKNTKTAFLLYNASEAKFSELHHNFTSELDPETGSPTLSFWEEHKKRHLSEWPDLKIPMWSQKALSDLSGNQHLEFIWPYFYKTTFLGIAVVLVPIRKGPPTNAEAREIEVLLSCGQGVYLALGKNNIKSTSPNEERTPKVERPKTGIQALLANFMDRIKQVNQKTSDSNEDEENKKESKGEK